MRCMSWQYFQHRGSFLSRMWPDYKSLVNRSKPTLQSVGVIFMWVFRWSQWPQISEPLRLWENLFIRFSSSKSFFHWLINSVHLTGATTGKMPYTNLFNHKAPISSIWRTNTSISLFLWTHGNLTKANSGSVLTVLTTYPTQLKRIGEDSSLPVFCFSVIDRDSFNRAKENALKVTSYNKQKGVMVGLDIEKREQTLRTNLGLVMILDLSYYRRP